MRLRRSRRQIECRMNIAPLVDVVFLLIIFFMAVSQLTRVQGEELELPKAKTNEAREALPAGRVIVNVLADGSIMMAGRTHTLESLRERLAEEAAGGGRAVFVLVRGDRNTPWEAVAGVMRACGEKGIAKLRVAVAEPDAQNPSDQ